MARECAAENYRRPGHATARPCLERWGPDADRKSRRRSCGRPARGWWMGAIACVTERCICHQSGDGGFADCGEHGVRRRNLAKGRRIPAAYAIGRWLLASQVADAAV